MAKTKAKSETSDLEILQNQGKTVIVDGAEILVKPFTFGQLLKALKYLANIGTAFAGGDKISDAEIIQLFAYNSQDVIGLLSLATGKDAQFFDNISPDAGIDLTMAAWEVNKDFFVKRLAPKIQELTKQNQKSEAGSLPSTN